MTEEKTSFEQMLPSWIKKETHVVVPAIDTVLIGSQKNLAITQEGLMQFGGQFNNPDELLEFTAQNYLDGNHLTANIHSSRDNSDLVIKNDAGRNAVNNLLVISALRKLIPRETDDYIFQPMEEYWAFDQPDASMIAMSQAYPISASTQEANRNYVRARARIVEEAKKVGVTINPLPYQDLIYLGNVSSGKPIVTLLEENSPQQDILEVLSR